MSANQYISLEAEFGVNNYHPLPVVLTKGSGVYLYDVDGKQYIDFLAAYSAVNQGHCHSDIVNAAIEQLQTLTLTSRAFHHSLLGQTQRKLCELFGFDRVILMNSGAEGVETAIKFARRWGYEAKGIPQNEAQILVANRNFHGRTVLCISASTDPDSQANFGPYVPNFVKIEFNNIEQLEQAIAKSNVAAFLIEPIQGEAGVFPATQQYLLAARELCNKHNVLFIADEIQTGLGRTGQLLACQHYNIKPDMVILGKALSGGILPVSAVLGPDKVMTLIKPGQHGSTFGGNPLACAVTYSAIDVLVNQNLSENARLMGQYLREKLMELKNIHKIIFDVRGIGLMNAIEFNVGTRTNLAWDFCIELSKAGVLAKPTHHTTIRLTPPLVITKEQTNEAIVAITNTLRLFDN